MLLKSECSVIVTYYLRLGALTMHRLYFALCCMLLSACGGGSGGSSNPPVTVPTIPSLNVTLTPSATSQSVTDVDSSANLTVQADYTGSTSDTIVPHISTDNNGLVLDGLITSSGTTYSAKLKTPTNLSAKSYTTTVTFRLCKESPCTTVYPGSTKSFTYTLDVRLADWTTRQRNASHNGFVRATFDPTKFAKAWEYAPTSAVGFDEVASRQGMVFLTQRSSDGSSIALAIDGATGVERWRYSLGQVSDASGPAISGNRVVFSTMFTSSGNNPLVALDADTGQFVTNQTFASQWSTFAPPTPFGDVAYIASGYYGNIVYAFDIKAGNALWTGSGSSGNTWDGQAPAVDANHVYYYSGDLDVIDRATGKIVKTIQDPFWQWNGYSYGGTPMLGSNNHVIAYSGNGQGTYSVAFPLVDYDIAAGTHRWRTASGYNNIPAVANGVVYAATNQVSQFDAIDELTGKVLWSWPLPPGEQFVGNTVVTDTLAFVSTNVAVYAIALDGMHQTKWTAKTPGTLSISPDAKLIVAPVLGGGSPAKVIAYSLQ